VAEKRRLPIVTGGAPPAPAGEEVVDREWHWAGIGAVLTLAVATVLMVLSVPLVLGSVAGGDLTMSERMEGIRDLSPARAGALVNRVVLAAGISFLLAATIAGTVVARFKRSAGIAEVVVGMLFAAALFAIIARQPVAALWLAPVLVGAGVLGSRLGRRLRARALSPRPQAPPD